MAAMAAMFVRSQKVVSVGSSFRTSRFNILRWGDEAVFGAVNLERRSVVGQPCRWLKRAAPKKALTPDKLAAVGRCLLERFMVCRKCYAPCCNTRDVVGTLLIVNRRHGGASQRFL
ncbi:uncharacterized protein LOC120842617 isoform X4 [Ixodes scapularis]|uniref:uncharacterized protein LOC120842617 isoform X4 n=1 Tax=Ixodes scapularis TaxID=6945 RepID=UPI001A9F0971|nr:uncharacterized protein LOC120842617 isoform X4 [Ixodes scapularis]